MGILPDVKLKELGTELVIPYDEKLVQPASIDVRLDMLFRRAKRDNALYVLDPAETNDLYFEDEFTVPQGDTFDLEPYDFALGSTFEVISVPTDLVARFEGKSSLGRLGLLTHVTAGFIDPGFMGHITLELKNVTNFTIRLHPGMRIGQLCFEELSAPVEHPYGDPIYGSHYQFQRGPTLSRSNQSFTTSDVYSTAEENNA